MKQGQKLILCLMCLVTSLNRVLFKWESSLQWLFVKYRYMVSYSKTWFELESLTTLCLSGHKISSVHFLDVFNREEQSMYESAGTPLCKHVDHFQCHKFNVDQMLMFELKY